MKIAIDIDDTLTNTRENQLKLWKEFIKTNPNSNYSEELPHNINEFDAGEYIDESWKYKQIVSDLIFTSSRILYLNNCSFLAFMAFP